MVLKTGLIKFLTLRFVRAYHRAMRYLTESDVREILNRRIDGVPRKTSQRDIASEIGITQPYLSMTKLGKCSLGPKVLEWLGYEAMTVYYKKLRIKENPHARKG
jgi:hypothetical protein